ncbi:hypothetical protein ACLOJK_028291 [Asimina triloba]
MQIYVVDSLDRERIGRAKAEFQAIIRDPFMLNSVILMLVAPHASPHVTSEEMHVSLCICK